MIWYCKLMEDNFMEILRNKLNRFDIKGLDECGEVQKGIAGFHGGFGAVIGWIAAKILHKAVPVKVKKEVYYLNCKSLKNWNERVRSVVYNKEFFKKIHNPEVAKRMIESMLSYIPMMNWQLMPKVFCDIEQLRKDIGLLKQKISNGQNITSHEFVELTSRMADIKSDAWFKSVNPKTIAEFEQDLKYLSGFSS